MKNGKNIFFYLTAILLACVLGALQAEARPRLAVRTFENRTDAHSLNAPAQAVTDMMTTELYNARIFSLMERERLDFIIDELDLAQSGLMDPATAPQAGRIRGAQYMMTGAVTQYRFNSSSAFLPIRGVVGGGLASRTALVTLDIRIINSETGEVVYAASESGTATREAGGLVTRYGGFATGAHGGILASATREAVMKHVASLRSRNW